MFTSFRRLHSMSSTMLRNYIPHNHKLSNLCLRNIRNGQISCLQRVYPISFINVKLYSNKNVEEKMSNEVNQSNTADDAVSKKRTLEGGVIVADISIGKGTIAKSGKTISVYYSGKLKSTNKVFDEMKDGPGLTFKLGRGDVISGWDIGVVGMKVGGKRTITCPPAMAYGAQGYPPVIPPNCTLIFEVELKQVK